MVPGKGTYRSHEDVIGVPRNKDPQLGIQESLLRRGVLSFFDALLSTLGLGRGE